MKHTQPVIQSNSGTLPCPRHYAEHLQAREAEYKRIMSIGFPNGAARDAYWRQERGK